MSFLNSVLAGITGEKPASDIVTTPPAYVPKTKTSTTDAPTAAAKGVKSTHESDTNTISSRKRKADDDSWTSRDKMPRPSNPSTSQLDNVKSISKPSSPVTFSPPVAKVPPRKGTFAEIMSRKVQPTAVGIYKHKPKERATAEERAAYRKQKKGKGSIPMGSKVGNPAVAQQELFPETQKRNKKTAEDRQAITSKKTLPPEPTYKGTARPRPREQPTYRGTARPNNKDINSSGSSRAGSAVPYGSGRHKRETHLDEDDEEDEDEEEDDYDSEASSDMEAAPMELEREEIRSRRIAELEDEEALREETRLRKQKEAKKRALAALAAKQRR